MDKRTEIQTANVVRLPTACAEPVQQHPRRGRFAKSIGDFRRARRNHDYKEWLADQRKAEIKMLDEAWWQALACLQACEIRLRELGASPTRMNKKFT